ncbi:MAG: enoyl-CoA hydratase-related protein [Acidobacteria bacterium]|nr:enoyl-CoA hydratase-related protein [Acidobacteriota bacterium]
MSELVSLTRDGEIGIITVNNPPVNALSPGVPEGIAAAIKQVKTDDSLKGAVLIGAGKTFIAGADIREFGKITSGRITSMPGTCSASAQIAFSPGI